MLRKCMIKQNPDKDFHVHFSAGIVEFPEFGTHLETLTRCADQAVYKVKENGRDGYAWYERDMDEDQ